ncbi:MAG TPA: hypothetical protein VJ814_02500, partial [Gaiellaceae bacterium]|nr:hypothetical protein [Gaiellaceae bacterium]
YLLRRFDVGEREDAALDRGDREAAHASGRPVTRIPACPLYRLLRLTITPVRPSRTRARALEGMTAVIVNLNKRYKGHAGVRVTGLP